MSLLVRPRLLARAAVRDPRDRAILLAQGGWLGAKAISLLTLTLSVPWTYAYLGIERFGAWMVLSTFSTLLVASDFGIGNGLMTQLARGGASTSGAARQRLLGNALCALTLIALALATIFLALQPLIDWGWLLNLASPAAAAEARSAGIAFVLLSLAAIPASLGQRIFTGLQLGVRNGFWAALGSLAGLAGLLLGFALHTGLAGLVVGFVGLPLVVSSLATVTALGPRGAAVRLRLADLDAATIRLIVRSGLRYFGIFVIYALTFTVDTIVIAQLFGPAAVARYAVADRLFQIIAVALSMINAPMWPAYAAAAARGETAWIRARFRASLRFNLLAAGGAALVLVAGAPWIYQLWIGAAMVPPLALAAAIALRRTVEAVYSACAMLLNALHAERFQLGWGVAMAGAALILRWVLGTVFGLPGVPVAVAIAVLLFTFLPMRRGYALLLTSRGAEARC